MVLCPVAEHYVCCDEESARSSSEYVTWSDSMTGEQCVGNDVEVYGRDLIWGTPTMPEETNGKH
jgi:hypothetical protein